MFSCKTASVPLSSSLLLEPSSRHSPSFINWKERLSKALSTQIAIGCSSNEPTPLFKRLFRGSEDSNSWIPGAPKQSQNYFEPSRQAFQWKFDSIRLDSFPYQIKYDFIVARASFVVISIPLPKKNLPSFYRLVEGDSKHDHTL